MNLTQAIRLVESITHLVASLDMVNMEAWYEVIDAAKQYDLITKDRE